MGTNCSKFWLGLGLGSLVGIVAYRFSCSPKGKMLKEKASHLLQRMGGKAGELVETAKDKLAEAGTKVADKVANGTQTLAEQADEAKNKMHSFAGSMKK